MPRPLCCCLALALWVAPACSQGTDPDNGAGKGNGDPGGAVQLEARLVVDGLSNPLHLTAVAGDERLFVVEQPGRIRILRDGQLLDPPFLDISDRVRSGGERGLLSVAFHPRYPSNGLFYVDYTDQNGDTRVVRFTVSSDPDVADVGSAHEILFVEQPFSNHNGGLVAFGPDGMLYVGMGDGGSGGDPLESGQDLSTLLGKLLRLDVDGGDPYAIPADNPYASRQDARGEIWAYGLRNPWRFSWDDGTLYVADVGQNRWEEINAEPANEPGLNYGWDIMEGGHCFEPASGCDRSGLVLPVHEYEHPDGCSITGGHVYRGSALPGIVGHYFYSDYCEGWLRSFRLADGSATERTEWDVGDLGNVMSFGVDAAGEIYVVVAEGRVYRLADAGA